MGAFGVFLLSKTKEKAMSLHKRVKELEERVDQLENPPEPPKYTAQELREMSMVEEVKKIFDGEKND